MASIPDTAKFSERLKGLDELAQGLNFKSDLVDHRHTGFRTTWSQHDLMMLQQGAGEKQHFLITIPKSIRDVKPENIAIKALHYGQAFHVQPEMRKGGLQWQS